MCVLSYLFYSFPLKLPNNGTNFSFPQLKIPNKENVEYRQSLTIKLVVVLKLQSYSISFLLEVDFDICTIELYFLLISFILTKFLEI